MAKVKYKQLCSQKIKDLMARETLSILDYVVKLATYTKHLKNTA